jgi:hypothetical protein
VNDEILVRVLHGTTHVAEQAEALACREAALVAVL